MKTIQTILILVITIHAAVFAQTVENGDIFTKISGIISNMPGDTGNEYQEPSGAQRTAWDVMLDDLFAANYSGADTKADALGYDLVQFSDNTTSETYYVLEKPGGSSNYWGTYVLNPNASRPEVVLMAPHPKFDFNTGKQGIFCFKAIDARFFMMSGTHRCNNSTASACSGTTTACGGSAAYRISDMAHVVDAIWQVTTEYLSDNFSNTRFIQLHGFNKTVDDPYVIMSNGTRQTPAPDLIVSIRDELLVVDPILTFKIAHIDLDWDRLIGFTNTNGRYINASSNSCTANATNASGRFIHIEQEKTRLRDDATGWQKMATALSETFPAAPLSVELTAFHANIVEEKAVLSWTTLSEHNHDFFEIEKSTGGHHFITIGKVKGQGNSISAHDYEFVDYPEKGIHYYRLRQVAFNGSYEFSKTVSVTFDGGNRPVFSFQSSNNALIVNVKGTHDGYLYFRLFDSLGRAVTSVHLSEGDNRIDLEEAPLSVYFYRMEAAGRLLGSGSLMPGQ